MQRVDNAVGNLGGNLQWFTPAGESRDVLLYVNEIDFRTRHIKEVEVKTPLKMVLRVANAFPCIADYWLGLFPDDAKLPAPFFVHNSAILPIKFADPATAQTDGADPRQSDAYYAITLPAGDYKVTLECRLVDEKVGNVGGNLALLDSEGEVKSGGVIYINSIGLSDKNAAKLTLKENADVIFRVRAVFAKEFSTFLIENWSDEQ